MEVLVGASSRVPILKHMHEIVIVQRVDALYQYYGINVCEHWIRDNLKDTFISLKAELGLDKSFLDQLLSSWSQGFMDLNILRKT